MIITKDFVILNYPKTGSNFVKTVLRKIIWKNKSKNIFIRLLKKIGILERDFQELKVENFRIPNNSLTVHGVYSQIPKKYSKKPVITVIRNPFDRFLSAYEYKHWQKFPPIGIKAAQTIFPHFPELTLDEYVKMQEIFSEETFNRLNLKNKFKIGSQTIQFIQMCFKDPMEILPKINESYIASKEYKKDIGKITFLRQEKLKIGLCDILKEYNYTEDELELIKNHKRVNVTNSNVKNKSLIWTQRSIEYVEKSERFLFEIFKDLGFEYEKPKKTYLVSDKRWRSFHFKGEMILCKGR